MDKRLLVIVVPVIVVVMAGALLLATLFTGSSLPFDAANATYSFEGDTFTLSGGQAQIMGTSGLQGVVQPIPIGYTLAASSTGDITGQGSDGEAVALYRNFGADLQWTVLVGFVDEDGTYEQVASAPVYTSDASVQSVSVANGIVTVDLLVVSAADQKNLPHYEQTPNTPLTLHFKISSGDFVAVTS